MTAELNERSCITPQMGEEGEEAPDDEIVAETDINKKSTVPSDVSAPEEAEVQYSEVDDVPDRLEEAEDDQAEKPNPEGTEDGDGTNLDGGGDLKVPAGGAQASKMEDPVTDNVMKHDEEESGNQETEQATGGETGKTAEGMLVQGEEEHVDPQQQHHHHHQTYSPYPDSPMPYHPYYGGYMYPPMYSYGGYPPPPPPYPGHQTPYGGGGGGHPPYPPPYNNITPSRSTQPPPQPMPTAAGGPSYVESAFMPPPFHSFPPTSPVVSPRHGATPSGGGEYHHFDPYRGHPPYGYAPYHPPSGGEDAGGSKYEKATSAPDGSDDDGHGTKKGVSPNNSAAARGGANAMGATPRSSNRLQVYVKAKQTVPRDVMDRRARKNAASRARSAALRDRIVQIELKPLSERTDSEINLLDLHNQRRTKKNDRSRVRSIERKESISRILSLPEKKRTKLEKQFLEASMGARERKNLGDRLRRRRVKEMGEAAKRRSDPTGTADGMMAPASSHPYHYPYAGGYPPPPSGGMIPPGYHPMMGYPHHQGYHGTGRLPYPEAGERVSSPSSSPPRQSVTASPPKETDSRQQGKTKQRSTPLERKTRMEVV